jgi:hypothetical protein
MFLRYPAPAATLQEFGYQNMKVNGQVPVGHRPLLVILANFAGRPALTHDANYYLGG